MISQSLALLKKSRDAMLAAIQTYNNPNITFKSEIFIVLSIIAWTYLVHSYLKKKHIDYRYFHMEGKRKIFDKTKSGNNKYWSLDDCVSDRYCNLYIDKGTKANLLFLLGIRHEIEHQMINRVDQAISARVQANCMDYNQYLKKWFGNNWDLTSNISYSLQFSTLSLDQIQNTKDIASNIITYIKEFDEALDVETFQSQNYAYRVIFTPKLVNHPGQADQVIEFIPSDTELSKKLNESYVVIKEQEKPKYMAKQIIKLMNDEGYTLLNQHQHTLLWKRLDAKNPLKNYGTIVVNYWYWYDSWIDEVRKFCKEAYSNTN